MKRVINFSGGKTSAYMTIMCYQPGDIVLFQDTGREHPKTYKFINDFEAFEGIPVTRVQMFSGEADSFRSLILKKKGKKLPNRMKRFCTEELKIKTAKRYLRSIGIQEFENFIGFRYDEPKRVLKREKKYVKVHDRFPLWDNKVTKAQVNAYWASKPYTLEIPSILGNCTLCFMKGENAVMAILSSFPELADPWIEDERLSDELTGGQGRTYFKGVKIERLLSLAQHNLFRDYDLEQVAPKFTCSCGGV